MALLFHPAVTNRLGMEYGRKGKSPTPDSNRHHHRRQRKSDDVLQLLEEKGQHRKRANTFGPETPTSVHRRAKSGENNLDASASERERAVRKHSVPPAQERIMQVSESKPLDMRKALAIKRMQEEQGKGGANSSQSTSSSRSPSGSPAREASHSPVRKKTSCVEFARESTAENEHLIASRIKLKKTFGRKRSFSVDAEPYQATYLKKTIDRSGKLALIEKKDPIHEALSKIRRKFKKWKITDNENEYEHEKTSESAIHEHSEPW